MKAEKNNIIYLLHNQIFILKILYFPSSNMHKISYSNTVLMMLKQGRLQEFGLWYADMRPMRGRGGGGSRGGQNFTVKNQNKQWINDMYNLFMIYITLFIIL